jgi:hypothetical protein
MKIMGDKNYSSEEIKKIVGLLEKHEREMMKKSWVR